MAQNVFRVDEGLRCGLLLGFSQILADESAGFCAGFAGVSPPAMRAMESHQGTLAGMVAKLRVARGRDRIVFTSNQATA
jgi:hypothetical protein